LKILVLAIPRGWLPKGRPRLDIFICFKVVEFSNKALSGTLCMVWRIPRSLVPTVHPFNMVDCRRWVFGCLDFFEHQLQMLDEVLLPLKHKPSSACGLRQLHNINFISRYILHFYHAFVTMEIDSHATHMFQSSLGCGQVSLFFILIDL
jgi:hypothetical protein